MSKLNSIKSSRKTTKVPTTCIVMLKQNVGTHVPACVQYKCQSVLTTKTKSERTNSAKQNVTLYSSCTMITNDKTKKTNICTVLYIIYIIYIIYILYICPIWLHVWKYSAYVGFLILWNAQQIKNAMGREHSTILKKDNCVRHSGWKPVRKAITRDEPTHTGRMILKRILKKYDIGVWTGFTRFRTGTNGSWATISF